MGRPVSNLTIKGYKSIRELEDFKLERLAPEPNDEAAQTDE